MGVTNPFDMLTVNERKALNPYVKEVLKSLGTAGHAAVGAFVAIASTSNLQTAKDWQVAGIASFTAFVTSFGVGVKQVAGAK